MISTSYTFLFFFPPDGNKIGTLVKERMRKSYRGGGGVTVRCMAEFWYENNLSFCFLIGPRVDE